VQNSTWIAKVLNDDYKLRYSFSMHRELLIAFNCSLLNICATIKIQREQNLRLTVHNITILLQCNFNHCIYFSPDSLGSQKDRYVLSLLSKNKSRLIKSRFCLSLCLSVWVPPTNNFEQLCRFS
jgi:hypothetical protein